MTDQTPEPLHPERLTWAALLGQWVEFARRAVGLPETDEGQRMRDSVPDVIMLQAVWCALREIGDLPPAERAIGLDRAGVLIERHSEALRQRWEGEAMPDALAELIGDAEAALSKAERSRSGEDDAG
ncbi:MAG: hypothetical protein ACOCTI_04710 [Phycisphaeraceae bacterium]